MLANISCFSDHTVAYLFRKTLNMIAVLFLARTLVIRLNFKFHFRFLRYTIVSPKHLSSPSCSDHCHGNIQRLLPSYRREYTDYIRLKQITIGYSSCSKSIRHTNSTPSRLATNPQFSAIRKSPPLPNTTHHSLPLAHQFLSLQPQSITTHHSLTLPRSLPLHI